MVYAPTFVPTIDADPISGDINRGAVTTSITPHSRLRRQCGDTHPPHHLQPRRGCRPRALGYDSHAGDVSSEMANHA